jgi:uncharacterized cupredoxin-like copper-binding protein
MNRTCLALLAAAVAASPAAAQDWARAQRVEVRLANFSYTPKAIHLKAGQPVILHLVNTASGGHDFTAPGFFAAAQVRAQDRGLIEEGSVEFRGHATHDVALVPKAGRYPLRCSHTFHKAFGMSGEIVVD